MPSFISDSSVYMMFFKVHVLYHCAGVLQRNRPIGNEEICRKEFVIRDWLL